MVQAREVGILDERPRTAREIHETIAEGPIGIDDRAEAAEQATDRRVDRDRHLDTPVAARDAGGRAPIGGGVDATARQLEPVPDVLAAVAAERPKINGIPVDVTERAT